MVMWIILGSLIAVVAIFLVITGILDRKKNKRLKIKAKELEILRENAQNLVAIWVNEVIIKNQELLTTFVPSIGKIKMKDIILAAKKSLILLTKKEIYKLALESKTKDKQIISNFKELVASNANNWSRKNHKTIKYFQNKAKNSLNNPENIQFINEARASIKGVYDEFTK